MPCWTVPELRRLDAMHRERRPSVKEMAAAFPRHSEKAVWQAARGRGLRDGRQHLDGRVRSLQLFWLRKAHLYFSRREQGRLA